MTVSRDIRYALGPAPGQRPLLDDPPCDCDGETVQAFIASCTTASFTTMQHYNLCAKATATALLMVAGALLNPANTEDGHARELCRERALEFAEIMEGVARRIRERAAN